MKTILLCGGKGSRISEETKEIPKPMIRIGNIPIIEHLMNIYKKYDYNDFILCAGYKIEIIKEYFCNYHLHKSDVLVNTENGNLKYLDSFSNNFNISIIDTGLNTLTGNRIKKIKKYVDNDDIFMINYSDGLADIDIEDLINFHLTHNKIGTMTVVQNLSKYGNVELQNNDVISFKEKSNEDWINGGFFVFNKELFDFILDGDFADTLEKLTKENQLMAYIHKGNWACVDTKRDKDYLESLWNNNKIFWKK